MGVWAAYDHCLAASERLSQHLQQSGNATIRMCTLSTIRKRYVQLADCIFL